LPGFAPKKQNLIVGPVEIIATGIHIEFESGLINSDEKRENSIQMLIYQSNSSGRLIEGWQCSDDGGLAADGYGIGRTGRNE